MGKGKVRSRWLQWLIPAAAVLLLLLAVQLLCGGQGVQIREVVPVEGVLDITGVDLSKEVVNVRNNWDFYPNALYTSGDFAAGAARAEDSVGSDEVKYGTYRLVIRALPERYYTLCSYSIDYSTRVFVNGTEAASFGTVADNAAGSTPRIGYMTLPLYSGASGEIEIIYQYANFVHRDGGFIQPTYLSTPQNMEQFKAGINLVSLSLSGGLLVLFLYFLLCAAVQRRRDFFLLSLCCLMMALRNQHFLVIHLLPSQVSWYVAYRIFMGVTILLPAMVLLLLRSMYPNSTRRSLTLLYLAAMAAAGVLDLVLPTQWLTTVCVAAWCCGIPYLLCLVYGIIRRGLLRKPVRAADVLTIGAAAVLVLSILLEAIYVNDSSAVSHYGIMPAGMLIFDFLMAVSISLRTRAQAAALAESRSHGEMLERMNAMNLDFLHQVAHELRTPLTVISGYAQLTGLQLSAGQITSETPQNLKVVRDEAQRLADMVTKLMEYSCGRESEVRFTTVRVGPLLERVRAICTPMCLKNGNRMEICAPACPDLYGSGEMLLQVFFNLVINANRHTQNGVITVSASEEERGEYVVFRVADTGGGIDAAVLAHVFEKGCSGDRGSGLGLSICREVVEAHGGSIAVEHTGPEGTVFAFTVRKREGEP